MKIFIWADGFWPRIGGGERHGFEIARQLVQRGHEVEVLSQKDHPAQISEEVIEKIPVNRFDFHEAFKKGELHNLQSILRRIQAEFRPQLLYFNTLMWTSVCAFLWYRKLFQIPLVVQVHSPHYEEGVPLFLDQLGGLTRCFCCPSKWSHQRMQSLLPTHLEKMRHLPLVLEKSWIERTPLPFSPPTFLLLGRLAAEKSFDLAIQAFAPLAGKARLLIVGAGPMDVYLQWLVHHEGIDDSVEFLGPILARDDIYHVINRSTALIVCSQRENYPFVALEAMQMGRPVIASNVGGLPEIVQHEERGLLIPPQDPKALLEAMQLFLLHPQMCQSMGERAFAWTQNFTQNDAIVHYENLFEECLKSS